MITVSEAKELVRKHSTSKNIVEIVLSEANGFVLAKPVYAEIDTPPFNQSAMDGYAFAFDSWDKKSILLLKGEVQAGNYSTDILKPNEAIRIYTGAPVPQGADTVVMQEKITVHENSIQIHDTEIAIGANVRLKGSQTPKGAMALPSETLLTPGAISYLASMGTYKVHVYSKPSVSIIVTGKELAASGDKIIDGKIYESNSYGLVAALQQLGIKAASVNTVDDDLELITKCISSQLNSDILILTGGVSVGDYDLVPAALEKCGVQKVFHKVKQKPGKPLYFGKHNETLVFGLPGNPAAALTCFYEYIVPAISSFTQNKYFKTLQLPLANNYKKKTGLTHFLKGKTFNNEVELLEGQASYLMNSFALANCIVELNEEKEEFLKGELVDLMMIE